MNPPLPFSATVKQNVSCMSQNLDQGERCLTDALLGCAGPRAELDKLQARGLSHLVVKTADISIGVGCSDIDHEVANLPVEIRGVDEPLLRVSIRANSAIFNIFVGRNNAEAHE